MGWHVDVDPDGRVVVFGELSSHRIMATRPQLLADVDAVLAPLRVRITARATPSPAGSASIEWAQDKVSVAQRGRRLQRTSGSRRHGLYPRTDPARATMSMTIGSIEFDHHATTSAVTCST